MNWSGRNNVPINKDAKKTLKINDFGFDIIGRRCIPVPVLKKKSIGQYIVCFCNPLIYLNLTISPQNKLVFLTRYKNRYRSASLTAEAALVFPVFFFAVYMFWQCFLLLLFQLDVCQEISAASMRYAHLGYPERKAAVENVDLSWLYQPLLWNAVPENEQVEGMQVWCIPQEDGSIQVEVNYQFVCEAVFFAKMKLPVKQTFRFYPYMGEYDASLFCVEEAEKPKDMVYMTEYGTVYHTSRACVYLTVTVRKAEFNQIERERNSAGQNYEECSKCKKADRTNWVYISSGGDKYHWNLNCSSMKRTVLEKSREEVAGIPACHKCGKE